MQKPPGASESLSLVRQSPLNLLITAAIESIDSQRSLQSLALFVLDQVQARNRDWASACFLLFARFGVEQSIVCRVRIDPQTIPAANDIKRCSVSWVFTTTFLSLYPPLSPTPCQADEPQGRAREAVRLTNSLALIYSVHVRQPPLLTLVLPHSVEAECALPPRNLAMPQLLGLAHDPSLLTSLSPQHPSLSHWVILKPPIAALPLTLITFVPYRSV